MTLEEMNRRWDARHTATPRDRWGQPLAGDQHMPRVSGVLPGAEDDDTSINDTDFPIDEEEEDEEDDIDTSVEEDLCDAVDILEEVMEVCGKFGQLRTHVGRDEKEELINLAQKIYEFLDRIGELEDNIS